jgi:thiazole synthase ThiGH ThiG subunit
MTQPCSLARALPDAIQVNLEVSASDDTSHRDSLQTLDSVRKIVKECIEELAKLPAAGCP